MGATESRSDAPLKKKSVEPKIESTISDDRTRGSAFDRNRDILSALADTENDVSSFEPTEDQLNDLSGSDNDSILLPVKTEALRSPLVHAREDYQMQLMLLEKQNEKRIRMAQRNLGDRAVQEEPDPVLWSHSRRQETAIRHQKPKTEGEQLSPVADGLEKAVPSEKPDAVVDGNDTIDTASSSSHATAQTALLKQLGIPKQYAGNLQMTQVYISSLRKHSNLPPEPKKPRELILHRVSGSDTYLDKPRWRDGANASSGFLGGKVPISDVRTYLLRHPEVAFIVCRDYKEDLTDFDTENVDENGNVNVYHCSESIIPAERNLALAIRRLNAFANQGFPSKSEAQNMENRDIQDFSNDWLYKTNDFTLSSPYLPFFHSRENGLEDIFECMGPLERVYFRRVVGYIVSNYNKEYEEVESLIRSGRIINAYLPYLFRPGIVVVEGKDENARGYVCESWLKKNDILGMPEEEYSYSIRAWHWDIGCRFTRNRSRLVLSDAAPWDKSEKDIYELELRPLSCVCHKTLERLQTRGQWIWKCLRRQIVGYRGKSTETFHRASGERYMVDMSTYSELHPYGAISEGKSLKTHVEPKDSELFAQEPPPDGSFVYATAAFMRGFNLKTKKWCDLCVDRFEEVEWNTNAFRSLVLNEKTKRLIQALVSNQIEAEMSTDIISGKGNGLIMLLHGGPGTGKTLTAESVAEIAQKPLYPVTCGDMGTDPKEVEKYLESVLHLGKTWGCVVLLDEADVFLEQRSLEDLKRNALVSVFLRVLEYYDGILILTSNRVGTFDEAFKSRIQLAIHYESLTEYQRTKVWGNFISRLKKLNEEGIDFADLEDNIENLARHKMNGREIRNVITTSRQYARWERKQRSTNHNYVLNYRVVEEVIETSGQFDKYIAKLNWGKTHDQLAEEDGLRLANGR